MSVVVSLEDFRPAPRYDSEPWTDARIEEAALATGPWATLETIALSPLDADPANPAYRNFTTQLGTAAEQWYRIVFLDADASTGLPTVPVQNVEDDRVVYNSTSELALRLKVNASTRHDELMRALKASAAEIDHEVGPTDINGATTPYSNPPAIVRSVSLERAEEHWKDAEAPFGILGLGSEFPERTARDTWQRHANKLAILKGSWGLA